MDRLVTNYYKGETKMVEKKWTPGPWFACHPKDLGMTVAKLDSTWVVKCDELVGPGEHDANLIAAAPDLVEALENLVDVVYGVGGTNPDAHNMARAALAKAYGETNHD